MKGFWERVDQSAECWNWKGPKEKDGYGVLNVLGYQQRAHRVAYVLENGRIPDGLSVLHRCDNRQCCNPDHLFLGATADNNADMWVKGRGVVPAPAKRGALNSMARLTQEQVSKLRSEYATGGISQRALGRKYGVSQAQVGRIVREENWTEEVAE